MTPTAHHVRRRGGQRVFLLFGMALVSTSFYFLAANSGRQPTNTRNKVISVKRHFKILDKSLSSAADKAQPINQLRRPFQWYRDNWYHTDGHDNSNTTRNAEFLESATKNLPQWMKEYFVWHRQQTTKHPAANQRYLILQCLEQDKQCGGLADRLLALPFLILIAAQTRRLLLIVWTVPFPLEEFLMPNHGIIDWMLPPATSTIFPHHDMILKTPSIVDKTVFTRVSTILKVVEADETIVRVRLQDYTSAWEYYNQHQPQQQQTTTADTNPGLAMQHFGDIFRALFVPSPPLQEALRQHQIFSGWNHRSTKGSSMIASPYSVAHYRALYNEQSPPISFLQAAAKNAVYCATKLLPGKQVAFLSDSIQAITTIQQSFDNQQVWIHQQEKKKQQQNASSRSILHLDKATRGGGRRDESSAAATTKRYQPSDFYDTFLDLYVMAGAQCVTYGQGGFGKMGSLLSRDPSCSKRHFEGGHMVLCGDE